MCAVFHAGNAVKSLSKHMFKHNTQIKKRISSPSCWMGCVKLGVTASLWNLLCLSGQMANAITMWYKMMCFFHCTEPQKSYFPSVDNYRILQMCSLHSMISPWALMGVARLWLCGWWHVFTLSHSSCTVSCWNYVVLQVEQYLRSGRGGDSGNNGGVGGLLFLILCAWMPCLWSCHSFWQYSHIKMLNLEMHLFLSLFHLPAQTKMEFFQNGLHSV